MLLAVRRGFPAKMVGLTEGGARLWYHAWDRRIEGESLLLRVDCPGFSPPLCRLPAAV